MNEKTEEHNVQMSDGENFTLIPVYGRIPRGYGKILGDTLLYWQAWNAGIVGYGTGISEAITDLKRFRRDRA